MDRSNEAMVGWAAGLFEGEGSWYLDRDGYTLRACLTMTDKDVVEKFAALIGRGSFGSRARYANRKQEWGWRLRGSDVVIEMAQAFWPYLGERRRARFDEIMAKRLAFIGDATAPRVCPGCGKEFRPDWNKAVTRKRYCTDACGTRNRWRLRHAPHLCGME